MKGIIVVSKFWTNLFSARKAAAITIFPFVFMLNRSCKADKTLVNHENIHIAQALEMLVIPFYVWYILEFLVRFCQLRNARRAYLDISFEREAYGHEHDLLYVKKRRFWAFVQYL